MTKIYEALEHAKNRKDNLSFSSADSDQQRASRYSKSSHREGTIYSGRIQIEESLSTLYQNINTVLPKKTCRIIQFISARSGEGTSLLTREFAKLCAFKFHKKVLLVDLATKRYSQMAYFNLGVEVSWSRLVQQNLSMDECLSQVDKTSLFVTSIIGNDEAVPLDPDSLEMNKCFEFLAKEFDYILIDFSITPTYSDSTVISGNIDGIVLVVEAEKTRWQVAERVKERLVAQGANILGVLLNKRTFPIPSSIYKFL
jgi:Mrp family chromosome partitioning ATPase